MPIELPEDDDLTPRRRLHQIAAAAAAAANKQQHDLVDELTAEGQRLGLDEPPDTSPELEQSSWTPVNMAEALTGNGPPAAQHLTRNDGTALIYPGRVHWIQGESESLKSWLLLVGVAQTLNHNGNVIWIDYEDDPIGVGHRLLNLGVPAETLSNPARFAYIQPTDALWDHRTQTALTGSVELVQLLHSNQWDLVGIDGVTEAMTVEGLSLLDNTDIATWLRILPKHITHHTGAAVVAIDHVTKSKDSQGRYAIGGQHKLAGTTGATYKVSAITPLSRAVTEPITGQSRVTIQKDRPGWVRTHAEGDDRTIAILEITSYPDGGVTAQLTKPGDATIQPPWDIIDRVLRYLHTYDGAGKKRIEEEVEGRAETVRQVVAWLVDEQWVSVTKIGNTHAHSITSKGREKWGQQ